MRGALPGALLVAIALLIALTGLYVLLESERGTVVYRDCTIDYIPPDPSSTGFHLTK